MAETDWAARLLETQRVTMQRMVAHLAAGGTTDMADDVMRVPAANFTSENRHAAEKQILFNDQPLLAGLSTQLETAGDVILFDQTGLPVFIVRGNDGVARGFVNRCSHRGARLIEQEGRKPLLTCPFHAWAFDYEGALVMVPGEEGFAGMDRDAHCLTPVPVAEWHGMIFVHAKVGAPEIDLDAHLGSFAPELAQLPFAQATLVKQTIMNVDANWKYALDTYAEGYHFAALHKDTLSPSFVSNVAVFDGFAPHHRITFPSREMANLVGTSETDWPLETMGFVHFVFPNTIVFFGSVLPGELHIQIFRLFPGDAPGQTRTDFAVYAVGGIRDEAHRQMAEMACDATVHVVTTEDYRAAALGWQNLNAAEPDFHLIYGRNEIGTQHQARAIDAALAKGGIS